MKTKKIIAVAGFLVFLILGVLILFVHPISDLNIQGQNVMGILVITIGIWIFKPFQIPFSAGGLFLAMSFLMLKIAPATVFSGFTQSALWTLIPSLLFGYVLQKTGLGKHIAVAIMGRFKPTYPMILLAWVIIGVVLSLLTPSMTVRVAIMMPVATGCCEMFAIEKGSKGNSLIQLVAFSVALIPGTGWLNGSLEGPIIQGMFDSVPALNGMIDFSSWFSTCFLPLEVSGLLLLLVGCMILMPPRKNNGWKLPGLKPERTEKWTQKELETGAVLCMVFILFFTNRWHGIPDAAVCLLAVVLLFLLGVLEVRDISSGINWDLVIFIGVSLGLGNIFSITGISEWLSEKVVVILEPVSGNPWLFVYGVMAVLFLWRFVDIALLIPTMAILTPILPAIEKAYGVSPLVWITLYVMAVTSFLMPYQNMWALMSRSMAGDRGWQGKHLTIYGLVYIGACFAALAAAIPMWISQGLL